MNPLGDDRFLLLARQCGLSPNSNVLDIGGGNGHASLLLCREWHCRVTLVDISMQWTTLARSGFDDAGFGDSIIILRQDASTFTCEPHSIDLTLCLGTSPIYGGFSPTLRTLRTMVAPGGHIIIGEPCMDRMPPHRYREYLEKLNWIIHPSHTLLRSIADNDCELLWLLRSTHDEWDRYMSLQWQAIAAHAAANPGDTQAQEFLDWSHDEQEVYLRYQRHSVDWNIMLLRVD